VSLEYAIGVQYLLRELTLSYIQTILSYVSVRTGAEVEDEAEVEPIRARDGLVAFDDLLESMRTKTTAKRALWSVPLMLTEDLVIGVKGSVHFELLARPVISH
jgi:hypothetical protein